MTSHDPFIVLGLPTDPAQLTDNDVRAAWRTIAAATHPDRPDGGDPQAYTAAAAAYAQLRTPWGRTEALADLTEQAAPGPPQHSSRRPVPPLAWRSVVTQAGQLATRVRRGRPRRLLLRAVAAAALATGAWLARAGTPATAAALALIVTWLVRTGRDDLAPPPGR
jgi:hypothetical protein